MQFDMALVSIHVSNLQVVRQGANYPNSEAEFLPQAPSTRVKCVTLAHSREVSGGVCSHFVDRRPTPTPTTTSLFNFYHLPSLDKHEAHCTPGAPLEGLRRQLDCDLLKMDKEAFLN
uniref:Uncharacterized protein n=1 Tax=Mesocestoides corti TaxID=53468 RepID=A0A5K3G398_MESCO